MIYAASVFVSNVNKITGVAMCEKDDIVLSFHDSLLRQSDIELLDGNRWLNDRLIGFVFEYFEKVQFKDIGEKVIYINPDVSQFIKLASDDELGLFLEPLALHSKERIFLVVNDNADLDSAGGSHWSLLMFDRADNTFHNYDSFHSSNVASAKTIATKTAPYIKASSPIVGFVEERSAQQTNGCDCGVYVICNAEALSMQYTAGDLSPSCHSVNESTVSQKRLDLKERILHLAEDGES